MQVLTFLLLSACLVAVANALVSLSAQTCPKTTRLHMSDMKHISTNVSSITRRSCVLAVGAALAPKLNARAEDPKAFLQEYADFTKTKEGWSYRDVNPGKGDVQVKPGDRVVFDWSGYTIGYFGRPFQAKG
jgi:hypothetical protein